MTDYAKNKWNAIALFYQDRSADILATPRNQWAMDPYEWDMGRAMIFMTPIESAFWSDIRQLGAVMYPQYPIAGFFADFANPVAKVVVECDGAQFHLDKAKDEARDAELSRRGWVVYRLTGRECKQDFDTETRQFSTPAKLVQSLIQNYRIGETNH